MDFNTVLIYSIIQSSVILLILFFKKFRNLANLFFGSVLVLLIILYYSMVMVQDRIASNPEDTIGAATPLKDMADQYVDNSLTDMTKQR